MKKLKLLVLSLSMLSIFMMTGCDNDNKKDANYSNLEKRVEQLEQEITILKNTATNNSANSSDNSIDSSGNTSSQVTSDTIESLTQAVDEVTSKADSATPTGNAEEKRSLFFSFKDELNMVEERLDTYDDYIESQYKRGSLSFEDYQSQERLLKNMEEKLDTCEDKLERTFGIDD